MNPHELNKLKAKAPVAIVLILIIWLLLPMLFIQPELERNEIILAKLDKSLLHARRYINLSKTVIEKNTRYNQLINIEDSVGDALPYQKQLPKLIDLFYKLADDTGLIISSMNYKFKTKDHKMKVSFYSIKFKIRAEYHELRKFLVGLESLEYPLIIQEVIASNRGSYSIEIRQLVKS